MSVFARFAFAVGLIAVLPTDALALDGRKPGSVLVYPVHRSKGANGQGAFFTVVSVSNVYLAPGAGAGGTSGTTAVEFDYVNATPNSIQPLLPLDCVVVDRTATLTPGDTLSVVTRCHNATEGFEGYLVVVAKDPTLEKTPWAHDYLIGSELVVTGVGSIYCLNAIPIESRKPEHEPTDMDADGHLDFDDVEYESLPAKLYIDSFIGLMNSSLVLINLGGGSKFVAGVHMDAYNDFEQPTSVDFTFRCWFEEPLRDIASFFDGRFLKNNTVNDPTELDLDCDGADEAETGWARICPNLASSSLQACPAVLLGAITTGPVFPLPGIGVDGGRLLWESEERSTAGEFLNLLEANDECGDPCPNKPPACDFTILGGGGVCGEPVTLVAMNSGDIVEFCWDFGDGTGVHCGADVIQYSFPCDPVMGTCNPFISLTVTDDDGCTSTCSQAFTLPCQGNYCFGLEFTDPAIPDGIDVMIPVLGGIEMEAKGVSYSGGATTQFFTMDFGDGSTPVVTSYPAGALATEVYDHQYQRAGVYTVTFTVSDDVGGDPRSCDRIVIVLPVLGYLVLSGDDADEHCTPASMAADANCLNYPARILSECVAQSNPNLVFQGSERRILAIGVDDGPVLTPAKEQILGWAMTANGGPGLAIDFASTPAEILAADFSRYSALYVPSVDENESAPGPGSPGPNILLGQVVGGITQAALNALEARKSDQPGLIGLETYLYELGGSMYTQTQEGADVPWAFLPNRFLAPLGGTLSSFFNFAMGDQSNSNVYRDVCVVGYGLQALLPGPPSVMNDAVSHEEWHNVFLKQAGLMIQTPSGPVNGEFLGLSTLVVQDGNPAGGRPDCHPELGAIIGGRLVDSQ